MRVSRILFKIALAALGAGVVRFCEVYASYRAKRMAKAAAEDKTEKHLAKVDERLDAVEESMNTLAHAILQHARDEKERVAEEQATAATQEAAGRAHKRKG